MDTTSPRLGGRRAEAARNDQAILDAARAVFVRDPDAPIAAVAEAAHVGVGALYRRYGGKEALLQALCEDGLRRFVAIAEDAWREGDGPWEAFADFVRRIVEADVHSLTVHLAGTFPTTEELRELARQADALATRLFRRARAAGTLRADVHAHDLPMLFEQLAAVRVGSAERTARLRRRYVALLLDGLRPDAASSRIPGPAPTADELSARWRSAPTGEGR